MNFVDRVIRYVIAVFALVSLALAPAHAATPAPKVVFIGDWATLGWTSAFAANPNWINQGTPGESYFGQGTANDTLARFQADVVDLHPAIVHILIGSSDAFEVHDANEQFFGPGFLASLDAMVKEARAANIQVVLGTEPANFSPNGPAQQQINSIIVSYGAAHNIPVINYGDALCGCISSMGGSGIGSSFTTYAPYLVPSTTNNPAVSPGVVPSPAGYALMTQMAEATINTLNARLAGGYLQNVQQSNSDYNSGPVPNVNTTAAGSVIQFTPYGHYSNGQVEPMLNTNFVTGSNGTWTSSNPLVVYINQDGLAWTISAGTAIITYTSPTGVKFNEWIEYVTAL